ncbi:MAG: lactonase family protein [Oscillospiraceae bacterium]
MGRICAYIGNWRLKDQPTKGISLCEYAAGTGQLTLRETVCPELCVGAAFLDTKRRVLYVTDERADHPARRLGGGGQIAAFSLSAEDGSLTELCRVPSYGANPASLVTDERGEYLLAVNHGSRAVTTQTITGPDGHIRIAVQHDESSVVLFPLGADGSLNAPCDLYRLSGEGPESFQLSPHAHSIRRAPGDDLYAVCDKGSDLIWMFRLDRERGKLLLCRESPFRCDPGAAPRYSVFHPTRPYLFVNMENRTIVRSFRYDRDGVLTPVCTVDSLPAHIPAPEGFSQSDLCLDPSGQYLYTLLRIVNVITVYRVDSASGELERIQVLENACDGARGCALSPDGRFLLVAALTGREVLSFPVGEDGRLSPAVSSLAQPMPGTVSFFAL